MRRARAVVLVAAAMLFAEAAAMAQPVASANAPETKAPPAALQDPLGRTTPRGAVVEFLSAARKGDDKVAALYLNTTLRGGAVERLERVLRTMLDEREFLSPYGIRSLSRAHADAPYHLRVDHSDYEVHYAPGESDSGVFGGNSNWRGPIWMPVNGLLVRALLQYYSYFGDRFKIECPTGSGHEMTLYEVAEEISRRLASMFLRDGSGQRPVYGGTTLFQDDPHWRDLLLFYEYFHGDNGAGLGASHQTGWTGIVARMMHLFATTTPAQVLATGKRAAAVTAAVEVGS